MSARPDLAHLSPEDLDLLISRSLDGDLNPEEQRELEAVLAADPEAARRREELAALVGSVRNLPAPDPPFALATRVNSQVAERTSTVGSFTHRFGVYLPPGVVGGAIALLVALVIGGAFFTKLPISLDQAAEPKPTGPVQVFFPPAEPQAQPLASREEPQKRKEPRAAAKATLAREGEAQNDSLSRNQPLKKEATTLTPESAGAPALAGAPAETRAREARRPAALAAEAPRPASRGEVNETTGRLQAVRSALTWSVEVQGLGRNAWRLKRAPEEPPSAPVHAMVQLSLDPSGHVIAVRPAAGEALTREVEGFARGLLFEPATESPPSVLEVEIGTR